MGISFLIYPFLFTPALSGTQVGRTTRTGCKDFNWPVQVNLKLAQLMVAYF